MCFAVWRMTMTTMPTAATPDCERADDEIRAKAGGTPARRMATAKSPRNDGVNREHDRAQNGKGKDVERNLAR